MIGTSDDSDLHILATRRSVTPLADSVPAPLPSLSCAILALPYVLLDIELMNQYKVLDVRVL